MKAEHTCADKVIFESDVSFFFFAGFGDKNLQIPAAAQSIFDWGISFAFSVLGSRFVAILNVADNKTIERDRR